jgi:hypothetical protein
MGKRHKIKINAVQPALAADRQDAESESRECGFVFSTTMKFGRRWAATEAPSLDTIDFYTHFVEKDNHARNNKKVFTPTGNQ